MINGQTASILFGQGHNQEYSEEIV